MFLIQELILPNGRAVNFSLSEGEDLIIRGSNGSGKSLFLKSLASLLPLQYERFEFQNRPLKEWRKELYRSKVLYLHQAIPKDLLTVEDFLSHPMQFGIYKDYSYPIEMDKYLNRWELKGMELIHLSMGQRQMLNLLRAVALKAEVLLLDEPLANLDAEKTEEAERLIREWKDRTGGSFLMISHDEYQTSRLGIREVQLEELTTKAP
jgi:putative ABC transport system ATP-binding protein